MGGGVREEDVGSCCSPSLFSFDYDPTMMLLMGIWMSFTKKPMNPMMANPIAVAMAIFWNSEMREERLNLKSL